MNSFATGTELDEYDAKTKKLVTDYTEYANTCREAIRKNNELIAKQQSIIDRINNKEVVSDADLAVLKQESGNEEENKRITDSLGGDRDLGRIKQGMMANTVNSDAGILPRTIDSYLHPKEGESKIGNITSLFKKNDKDGSYGYWELDDNQLDQYADYIQTLPEFGKLREFLLDAPRGYHIPDMLRERLEGMEDPNAFSWSKLFKGMAFSGGGMLGTEMAGNSAMRERMEKAEKEDKSDKGKDILDRIMAYDESPSVKAERERMRKALGEVKNVSDGLAEGGAKLEAVNDASDKVQANGGSFGDTNTVNNQSTKNEVNSERQVNVNASPTIQVTQYVGTAEEAGTALKSVSEKADQLTLEKVLAAFQEQNGKIYDEVSMFYGGTPG